MSFASRLLAGKNLNPIGLGCMSLSQAYYPLPSEREGEALLHRALDLGCHHLDSARLYGLGKNEALIARVLKTRRDEVFITSKCGIEFDDGNRRIDCKPETIRRAVEKSLATLGTDFIDLYYLHRRDVTTPIEEAVGALAQLVDEGKIGAIGLSEMSTQTLKAAAKEHPIAAMQSEYSLFTRNPEIAVLETCRKLGTAFVAFSPVARGVLADGVADVSSLDERDLRLNHPRFEKANWDKNQKLVTAFNAIAKRENMRPAQLSLSWVLAQGAHIHVIPGTASIAHLQENMDTLNLSVSQKLLDELSALINQSTVAGHRYAPAMRKAIDTEEF